MLEIAQSPACCPWGHNAFTLRVFCSPFSCHRVRGQLDPGQGFWGYFETNMLEIEVGGPNPTSQPEPASVSLNSTGKFANITQKNICFSVNLESITYAWQETCVECCNKWLYPPARNFPMSLTCGVLLWKRELTRDTTAFCFLLEYYREHLF